MAKRASVTRQAGSVGETSVKKIFEEMGWGPVPVEEHDNGSDSFVQVRDSDLYELGLLLGVQVKNEKKYFKPAVRSRAMRAEPPGWEYRATQDDANYWLDHAIPHVVVIYDRSENRAYWGQVTRDTVTWTNKAAKIWIPATQQLTVASRDQLQGIAATLKPPAAWTGSLWDNLAEIPPARRLRYALLCPRVAAPHRNRMPKILAPEEAIASQVLVRVDDLTPRIPSPEDRDRQSFQWRFYDAISSYIRGGGTEVLRPLAHDESSAPSEKTASSCVYSAALAEHGDFAGALAVAESVNLDLLDDPVDRAWIKGHRARCMVELGMLEDARAHALDVAAVGLLHPDDPTALTLRAAALNVVFSLSGWDFSRIEEMIRANDSAPAWWRSQQRSWGLSSFLEESFERWSGKDVTGKGELKAWRDLRSITLVTGFGADQRSWRSAAAELAQLELVFDTPLDASEHSIVIRDLRLAGDTDALKLAARRIGRDGPIDALASACEALDLAGSTWTSRDADLELACIAHDAMRPEDAERHAEWALSALLDNSRIQVAFQHSSHAIPLLIRIISNVWLSLSFKLQDRIREYLVSMPPLADQVLAEKYGRLVATVGAGSWSEEQLARIKTRCVDGGVQGPDVARAEVNVFGDHRGLSDCWRGVLAKNGETQVREQLYDESANGSEQALLALGSFREMPSVVAERLILGLRERLAKDRDDALNGSMSFGALDRGQTLLRLNVKFPAVADWEPVEWVLQGPPVFGNQLGILDDLGSQFAEEIDPSIVERLIPYLERLANQVPVDRISFFGVQDVDLRARRALYNLINPLDDSAEVLARLANGVDGKRSLAHALGRFGVSHDIGLLSALSHDENPRVREAATTGCILWLLRSESPMLVRDLLDGLLEEAGTRNAGAAMRAIPHRTDLSSIASVLNDLAESPSAGIRKRAKDLLNHPADCSCE